MLLEEEEQSKGKRRDTVVVDKARHHIVSQWGQTRFYRRRGISA